MTNGTLATTPSKSVFSSIAFQITFCAKIYFNDFFLKKKLFLTSAHQNNPKHTNHIKF
jgi:hypothetical protein